MIIGSVRIVGGIGGFNPPTLLITPSAQLKKI